MIMEDRADTATGLGQTLTALRSELKVIGGKCNRDEVEQIEEISPKRVKMRDLESVLRSEGTNNHSLWKGKESCDENELAIVETVAQMTKEPFHMNPSGIKSVDVPECGSTCGSQEEVKDPLRVWKEMKQNGFLSSSHGGMITQLGFQPVSSSGIPIPIPKQRGRKPKADVVNKKRLELAKKQQVDKFTKLAAPTGLLNELNPGIINHVRNGKQVRSIIEAIARLGELENGYGGRKTTNPETSSSKDTETMDILGHRELGDGNFALSQHTDSMLNKEPTSISSVSSLSIKAATVASQWLELLHQDIKGRLTALRRSKKKVQSVITLELPGLLSTGMSSNKENDSHALKTFGDGLTIDTVPATHRERWKKLFDQMDRTLAEEEIQLESWLSQVKEMKYRCEYGLQQPQTPEMDSRCMQIDSSAREMDVGAAAASIYSTCNFNLSLENLHCF